MDKRKKHGKSNSSQQIITQKIKDWAIQTSVSQTSKDVLGQISIYFNRTIAMSPGFFISRTINRNTFIFDIRYHCDILIQMYTIGSPHYQWIPILEPKSIKYLLYQVSDTDFVKLTIFFTR